MKSFATLFLTAGAVAACVFALAVYSDRTFDPSFRLTSEKQRIERGHYLVQWDPLESTCRHASLSIL